ncbi:MAG: hypothetical protein ACLRIS_04575 [Flavonifractor plautii]
MLRRRACVPRCAIWWWMCPARGRNWRRGCGRSMARRCCGRRGGPDVTLAFGPGGEERGTVLRLYGPVPGLAGLRPILEEGAAAGPGPLPLLSLLWECGRLTEGQIRIHAT